MKFTLGKKERLKSRKLIEKLYVEGKAIKVFPLRIVFLQIDHASSYPAQAGFSVPKRNFKLAVKRNRIKRLLRESYRLQKDIVYSNLEQPYIFMISYIGKEEKSYQELYPIMEKLLRLFINKTQNINKDEEL